MTSILLLFFDPFTLLLPRLLLRLSKHLADRRFLGLRERLCGVFPECRIHHIYVPCLKENQISGRRSSLILFQSEVDILALSFSARYFCIASFNAWAVSLAVSVPKRIDKATTLLLISSCNGVPPFPQISGRKEKQLRWNHPLLQPDIYFHRPPPYMS